MIHIRTLKDLENLKCQLPKAHYDFVEQQFNEVKAFSSDLELSENEFVLDSGHLVLIEASDKDADMEPLLTSWPEYSLLIQTEDGTSIWKIVCLLDNDFIMTYISERGIHEKVDALAERYLDTECFEVERGQ